MIIEYIRGDLFDTDCRYIAHGCNAQGVMGSGVAKIVREKYPNAYDEYVKEYKKRGLQLGSIVWASCGNKTIVNCITQNLYGRNESTRYVSYDAIADCFEQMQQFLATNHSVSHHNEKVAIPKIGAGLGGGDWNIIERIIDCTTPELDIVVYDPEYPSPGRKRSVFEK